MQNKDFVVRVCEESAGGYSIIGDKGLAVKAGQMVTLATGAGCSEARVVHITDGDDGIRMGLQRIRDIKGDANVAVKKQLGFSWSRVRTIGRAVVVVLICVLLFIVAIKQSRNENMLQALRSLMPAGERPAQHAAAVRKAENRDTPEEKLAADFLKLDHAKNPELVLKLNLDATQQGQRCHRPGYHGSNVGHLQSPQGN